MVSYFRMIFLTIILMFTNAVGYADDASGPVAIDPYEWNYESVTNQLHENYERGEKGVPEIIALLEKALGQPANSTNLSLVGNAVYYLHKLIMDGHKSKEIGCALVKAIEQQADLGATLDTADALKDITGIDVRYDEKFVGNFNPDSKLDLQRKSEKIQVWAKKLGCSAEK